MERRRRDAIDAGVARHVPRERREEAVEERRTAAERGAPRRAELRAPLGALGGHADRRRRARGDERGERVARARGHAVALERCARRDVPCRGATVARDPILGTGADGKGRHVERDRVRRREERDEARAAVGLARARAASRRCPRGRRRRAP